MSNNRRRPRKYILPSNLTIRKIKSKTLNSYFRFKSSDVPHKFTTLYIIKQTEALNGQEFFIIKKTEENNWECYFTENFIPQWEYFNGITILHDITVDQLFKL